MPSSLKVPRGCGFVVTELGRSAAASVETCECKWDWSGQMLKCTECGSGYTLLRELPTPSFAVRRKRD